MQPSTRIFPNKLITLLLATGLCFTACKSGAPAPLSQQQMESVLLDIHIAEAYSSVVGADSLRRNAFGKNSDTLAVWYKAVLERNNISYPQLKSSMEWYQQHPGMLDSIYAHVRQRLDSMKENIK